MQDHSMALQAPLAHQYTVSDAAFHNQFLKPMLGALLVGAHILELSTPTRFSAAVLLHRFYGASGYAVPKRDNSDDDVDDDKYVVAACLLLACKREEEPRRLRDAINVACMVHCAASEGADSSSSSTSSAGTTTTVTFHATPPALDEKYWKAKQKLIQVEQHILRWLAFNVAVPYPHRALLLLIDDIQRFAWLPETTDIDVLKKTATKYLNSAIFCATCLQHSILSLAVAAISLAANELTIDELKTEWWTYVKAAATVDVRSATSSLQDVQKM